MVNKRRAITIEQKREIIVRLYRVWCTGDNKHLRLGQLLAIVFEEAEMDMKTGESKHFMCLFSKEDYDLIEEIEKFFKKPGEKN